MNHFMDHFPPEADVLEMEPEELAPFILRYLKATPNDGTSNRYNFGLACPSNVAHRFMEAWMWLEREGFLAPKPGDTGNWVFITRRGMEVEASEDFAAYQRGALFPNGLDPALMRHVKPLFLRGDYDTAVFRAFKEVEVRVRSRSGLGPEEIGRALMNTALGPTGPLKVSGGHKDDQAAIRELFAGAISACKNPSSHQEVQFDDPREVLDMICFANHLLRIVGRLTVQP